MHEFWVYFREDSRLGVSNRLRVAVVPRKGLRWMREGRGCHSYIGKINKNSTRVLLVFFTYLYKRSITYHMQLGTLILSMYFPC